MFVIEAYARKVIKKFSILRATKDLDSGGITYLVFWREFCRVKATYIVKGRFKEEDSSLIEGNFPW